MNKTFYEQKLEETLEISFHLPESRVHRITKYKHIISCKISRRDIYRKPTNEIGQPMKAFPNKVYVMFVKP